MFSNGSKAYPKERLEVFSNEQVLQLDNFRKLQAWGIPGFHTKRVVRQDKGQVACCKAFLEAIKVGGSSPIDINELIEVHHYLFSTQG